MDKDKIPKFFKDDGDARNKAKETLIKLFENKIINIDNIKKEIVEFQKYESQNSIEVFDVIGKNIEETTNSMEKIAEIIENIETVKKSMDSFLENWNLVTNSINNYGVNLENLMNSKRNVSMLRHNLSIYVKIKDQVNILRESINANDNNVVNVFKHIRYFFYLRNILLEKCKNHPRSDRLQNLADHLQCVITFHEEFFNKFWRYFYNAIDYAVAKPEFLVKLVRLIEEDPDYMRNIKNMFHQYTKTDEKFVGLGNMNQIENKLTNVKTNNITQNQMGAANFPNHQSKALQESLSANRLADGSIGNSMNFAINRDSNQNYGSNIALFENLEQPLYEIFFWKIKEFIKEKFDTALFAKTSLDQVLELTIKLSEDLIIIKDKLVQIFPPKYNIFERYFVEYQENIYNNLYPFVKDENEKYLEENKGDLILLAKWLDRYENILRKVGIDINQCEIGAIIINRLSILYDKLQEELATNIENIIQRNMDDKRKIKENKNINIENITSYFARDCFTTIFYIIDMLSGDVKGKPMYDICKITSEKLLEIENKNKKQLGDLNEENDLIVACVFILDALSCREQFPQYSKKLKGLMQPQFYNIWKSVNKAQIKKVIEKTILEGCQKLIEILFLSFEKNYLKKMFTNEWNSNVLNGIFTTFKDNFDMGFVKIIKDPLPLVSIIKNFLEYFINYYLEELIYSVRSINKKKITNNMIIGKYELHFIKAFDCRPKDKEKTPSFIVKNQPNNKENNQVKEKTGFLERKNYYFAVKELDSFGKNYVPLEGIKKFEDDLNQFKNFLDLFRDEQPKFSKNLMNPLGKNYLDSLKEKFEFAFNIVKCQTETLTNNIQNFKTYFHGEEGKALFEGLIFMRENYSKMNANDKLFYSNVYG